MTERYDPDGAIIAHAMAEIRATCDAAQHPGRGALTSYHSESPRAVARRELLRALSDKRRAEFMGETAAEDAA